MKKLVVALALALLTAGAHAATVTVDCRTGGSTGRIQRALGNLDRRGPNTVNVVGTCRENVVIRGYDRLRLIAGPGAGIRDASGGQSTVLEVLDSRRVEIRGFQITGGRLGVTCFDASQCRLSGNTIEGSSLYGLVIGGSQVTTEGDTVQDTADAAVSIDASTVNASNLTVRRGAHGIFVSHGTVFLGAFLNVSSSGDGIGVDSHSHLSLSDSEISGNGAVGVNVSNGSQALLGGRNSIRGNGIFGVGIGDLSQVYFESETVTGNQQQDIGCYGRYSVATHLDATVWGTTDCEVPQ